MTETSALIVTWQPAAGAPPQESHVRDLAPGGLFIETPEPLVVGVVVRVDLVADGKKVRVAARIVFVRDRATGPDAPAGMAMRFLDAPRAMLKDLAEAVEARRADAPTSVDAEPYRAMIADPPAEDENASASLRHLSVPPFEAAPVAGEAPAPLVASAVDPVSPIDLPVPVTVIVPPTPPDTSAKARLQLVVLVVLMLLGFVGAILAKNAM